VAVDAPAVGIAPEVTARHAPGHTPGHYVLSVTSEGQAAYLLGDAVHHPLQLADNRIRFLSDVDPGRAAATREELFALLAGQDTAIGTGHFPGLDFQYITAGEDRHWSPVA
jgi:glyoxylase-like metal-dependent hydrolase (beta-lactamase superfamily II)